jgi:hypothetical protein
MVAVGVVRASPRDALFRDANSFFGWRIASSLVTMGDSFARDFQGNITILLAHLVQFFFRTVTRWEFEDFIDHTILERVGNGSLSIWGRVGAIEPPHLVMPMTIELSKPRMCHDERLNLWIRDLPFSLDYISNTTDSKLSYC